ncbi:MAG TPA: hypothetical protein VKP64_14820, partial [Mycobacteriales bacterium]|nr:hypothetical protein [Mycobacteriales bacterium]
MKGCRNAEVPLLYGKIVIAESQFPVQKGTREVNGTGLLFDVEDPVLARPARPVPTPVVSGSEADLT